jgi:hypothetical protein
LIEKISVDEFKISEISGIINPIPKVSKNPDTASKKKIKVKFFLLFKVRTLNISFNKSIYLNTFKTHLT